MNKFVLFVLAAVLVAAASTKVGVKMTMNQYALNHIKDALLPVAERAALTANIPDMEETAHAPVIGKISVHLKNIKINTLTVKNSSIIFASNNQLVVTLQGVHIDVHLGWHYREKSFPHVHDSGTASASTSNAGGDVVVVVGVDAHGHPTAQIAQGFISLGSLSISVHGGAKWLYQVLISVFHDKIVAAIQKGLNSALTGQIQSQLSRLLANVPTQHSLGNNLAIDYSIGRIAIQNNLLTAGSAGEFFPKGSQPGKAPGSPIAMPDSIVNKQVQIFLSSFTGESLGYAIMNSGLGHRTLNKDQVSSIAKQFFNTNFYSQYAPGIIKKYGANVDVQLYLGLHQTPNVIFKVGQKAEIKAGLELTVRVKTGSGSFNDAFTVLVNTDVHGDVKVSNTVISGSLTDVTCTSATLVQTQVGSVDVNGINDLFQFAMSMSQDYINGILAKGAPLPAMPGMKFLNPQVIYQDGYIVVATDISFSV